MNVCAVRCLTTFTYSRITGDVSTSQTDGDFSGMIHESDGRKFYCTDKETAEDGKVRWAEIPCFRCKYCGAMFLGEK
jgi:hypothetical protein